MQTKKRGNRLRKPTVSRTLPLDVSIPIFTCVLIRKILINKRDTYMKGGGRGGLETLREDF